MARRNLLGLALVSVAVLAVAVSASASIIPLTNGNFETDFIAHGYSYTATGWNGFNLGDAASGTWDTANGGQAGGNCAAWITDWHDSPIVSQQLSATYVAGSVYTFSIDMALPPAVTYTNDGHVGGRLVLGYMNGSSLVTLASQDVVGTTSWQNFNVQYTATAAAAGKQIVVGFGKLENPSWTNSSDFDNANLEVTAAPEPATMSLVVLGGLAMLKRRK